MYLRLFNKLLYISDDHKATLEIHLALLDNKANQKLKKIVYPMKDVLVKGAQARGIRIATQKVKKVEESDQLLLV